MIKSLRTTIAAMLAAVTPLVLTEETANIQDDLFGLELEMLMDIQVVSVTKKPQSIADSAAAIYVISSQEIKQSGQSKLVELLRGVPGLNVAQIDANKWVVAIRGSSGRYTNKLLVMIDGRSIYSPLFSGVYWNMQDLALETIDRIEIIRGSGGSLWGANAVNGVINIITKDSTASQGGHLSIDAAQKGHVFSGYYGAKLDENTTYRIASKVLKYDDFDNIPGVVAHDAWDNLNISLRLDHKSDSNDHWMIELGSNNGTADQTTSVTSLTPIFNGYVQDTIDYSNNHLLLRYNLNDNSGSNTQVQFYTDFVKRDSIHYQADIDTYDLDFQQQQSLSDGLDLVWGLGYRNVKYDLDSSFTLNFSNEQVEEDTFNAFIHAESKLTDNLQLTIGSKIEENSITGFEFQPNIRANWKFSEGHSIWVGITRAVRVPSRSDIDMRINYLSLPANPPFDPEALPILFSIMPTLKPKSEVMISHEIGYRGLLSEQFSIDLNLFHNDYKHLLQASSQYFTPELAAFPPPHLLAASQSENNIDTNSTGLELSITWRPSETFQAKANLSHLKIMVDFDPTIMSEQELIKRLTSDPEDMASLSLMWTIHPDLLFTSKINYVDKVGYYNIDAYTRLDMNLKWRVNENFSLTLYGTNISSSSHTEYTGYDVLSTRVPSIYGLRVEIDI